MSQENETAVDETLRRRSNTGPWWRVLVGALLVVIGIDILLEQITGYEVSFVPLAVGLGLLTVWWQINHSFGFLIAGSIVTGVGIGQLLSDLTHLDGMFQLGLAGGFAFLAFRSHRASWAWWPAAILGAIGIISLAFDLGTFFAIQRDIARVGAPAVAIALGLLLILRPNLDKGLFRVLVVALIVIGVIMVSSLPDRTMFNGFQAAGRSRWSERDFQLQLPSLEGRTLVVDHSQLSVELVQGPFSGFVHVRSPWFWGHSGQRRAGSSVVSVRETSDEVILEEGPSSRGSYRLVLSVPPSTVARIRTGSGDVRLSGQLQSLEVRTGAGDVSGQLHEPYDDLSIETGAGDIDLTVFGDPSIRADTGGGDMEVNGEDVERFEREGAGGTVDLQTGAGDIQLSLPGPTA